MYHISQEARDMLSEDYLRYAEGADIEDNNTFSDLLVKAMALVPLNDEQVAKDVGVTPYAIRKWMINKTTDMPHLTMRCITIGYLCNKVKEKLQ